MLNWKSRLNAAGIHLGLSLAIAVLAAILVFGLWYPYPYREISGGRELFLIVVTVDVILGPLITLTIFNRAKPVKELRRDLVVVALVQLAGLGYGLWTVSLARPAHLVFEFDRFRVVHIVDIPIDLMDKAPSGIDAIPLGGPTLLAVRPFKNDKEKFDATMLALKGIALSARPDLWQPYDDARPAVLKAGKPIADLEVRHPSRAGEIAQMLRDQRLTPGTTLWVPMVARKLLWTVLIDATTAEVVGFLPLDSF
ncbi:MAG: TfpX/TfpZ family type IV pilin accessory protein [Ramlibacter sp.]